MQRLKLILLWIFGTFVALMFLVGFLQLIPNIDSSFIGLMELVLIFMSIRLYRKYVGKHKRTVSSRKKRNVFTLDDDKENVSRNENKKPVDLSLYTNHNQYTLPNESDATEAGRIGENRIAAELRRLGVNRKTTRNLIIGNNNETTEIDFVYITECGIYVIESKNYNGWIFGNLKYKYWTQTFPNKAKHQFYNPIHQNFGHINALKTILTEFPHVEIRSIIVFSDTATLKNVPESSDVLYILNESELYDVLKASIEYHTKLKRKPTLSLKEIYQIWDILNQYEVESLITRNEHISNVQRKIEVASKE